MKNGREKTSRGSSTLIIYSLLVFSMFIQRRGKWSFLFPHIIFLFLRYSIDMRRLIRRGRDQFFLFFLLFYLNLFKLISIHFNVIQGGMEQWSLWFSAIVCRVSQGFSQMWIRGAGKMTSENYIKVMKLFSKWIPLWRSLIRWRNSNFINLDNWISLALMYQFIRSPFRHFQITIAFPQIFINYNDICT
jgi:hypothetical protein